MVLLITFKGSIPDGVQILDRDGDADADQPRRSTPVSALEGLPRLSRSLDRVFQSAKPSDWLREFFEVFTEVTRSPELTRVASLDALANNVRSGRKALIEATSTRWTQRVTSRLEENALPVFNRQLPLTANKATAIRLAALCLAAEADVHCPSPVGDTFRNIATGITLLERRSTGQAPATEIIILATT